MKTVDCRGLACPGPVIQVKKNLEGLEAEESLVVVVDSEASRDNVQRFVRSRGLKVDTEETGAGVYHLTVTGDLADRRAAGAAQPVVLLFGSTMGTGDDKLGGILMEGFVNTLPEQDEVPDCIILMNSGVELAVDGSPVLGALRALTDRGCEVLVCGTCLEYFGLKERLEVGVVSNMYDIQRTMLGAAFLIRP